MMKRSAIIEEIVKKTKFKRATVKEVLDAFEVVLFDSLKDDNAVSLGRKVGKLVVKEQKGRKIRDPKTGKTIEVPARRVVKFKMSRALKEALIELPF